MEKQKKCKIDKILNCPRCSSIFFNYKMRKLTHPKGIVLDVCDNCNGMWVDGDEIAILYGETKESILRKNNPKNNPNKKLVGGKNGKKSKKFK